MTYRKTSYENFIVSFGESREIILIFWGHVCNMLPTSWSHRLSHKDKRLNFHKNFNVHGNSKSAGCNYDKAYLEARSACLSRPISLSCGIQQNVLYFLLINISWHVRPCLQKNLYSYISLVCDTGIPSEKATTFLCPETFTYFKDVLIASISAAKILPPYH